MNDTKLALLARRVRSHAEAIGAPAVSVTKIGTDQVSIRISGAAEEQSKDLLIDELTQKPVSARRPYFSIAKLVPLSASSR